MQMVSLNKDTRIKRCENYEVMAKIRNVIAQRIQSEYAQEIKALSIENDNLLNEERAFIKECSLFFSSITPETPLKITIQVGSNSEILHTYVGYIENKLNYNQTHFNFISAHRHNDLKPFTVAFSCLQSVEIVESILSH